MAEVLAGQYYAALERGELVIQQCNACSAKIMYPKYACPSCASADLGWASSSGQGVLHSFAVLRAGAPTGFEDDLPYALGVIKLDEGVQLLGRLRADADGGWDGYSCDMRVEFQAESDEGRHIAWFRPA